MATDGRIYNCGRAFDAGGQCFGSLSETGLEAALEHAARGFLQGRDALLRDGPCSGCQFWELCHGGCPYDHSVGECQAQQPTIVCPDYRTLFTWFKSHFGDPTDRTSNCDDQKATLAGITVYSQSRSQSRSETRCERPRSRASHGHVVNWVTTVGVIDRLEGDHDGTEGSHVALPSSLIVEHLSRSSGARLLKLSCVVVDHDPACDPDEIWQEVAERAVPAHLPPGLGPTGLENVRTIALRGVAVVLLRPKQWASADLRDIARFFLTCPDLEVPVEPFFSLVSSLSPRGEPWSLVKFYEESPLGQIVGDVEVDDGCSDSAVRLESEATDALPREGKRPFAYRFPRDNCFICPAFKSCRGYWFREPVAQSHCYVWRAIVDEYRGRLLGKSGLLAEHPLGHSSTTSFEPRRIR